LSADTIVPGYTNPQNLNRFSYVLNNPLRYTDPTGHRACDDFDSAGRCNKAPGGGGAGFGGLHPKKPKDKKVDNSGGTCGSGNYSPSCPGWHEYTMTHLVCPAYLHCLREEMIDSLSRFAFPGQDPNDPVVGWRYDAVTDPWYGILPESLGPISTVISNGGLTVTNTTLRGHVLHDGKIVRNAFQGPNGAWYVTTHGYGNNEQREVFDAQRPDLPPITANLSLVNIWGGKAIFNKVDALMLNYIIEHHP